MNRILAAGAIVIVVSGCSDNAVHLRTGIDAAVAQLATGADLAEQRVLYRPVADPSKAYWIVFLPEHRSAAADLVDEGMPASIAERIFRDLAYVNIEDGKALVVFQEGERLSFTSYRTIPEVRIPRLLVAERTDYAEIVVRRQNGAAHIIAIR